MSRLRLGLSVLETSVGGTAASQLADELENTSDARKRRDELTNDSSLPLFYQRLDRLQALLTSQPIVLADPSVSCVLEEGTGEVGFPMISHDGRGEGMRGVEEWVKRGPDSRGRHRAQRKEESERREEREVRRQERERDGRT